MWNDTWSLGTLHMMYFAFLNLYYKKSPICFKSNLDKRRLKKLWKLGLLFSKNWPKLEYKTASIIKYRFYGTPVIHPGPTLKNCQNRFCLKHKYHFFFWNESPYYSAWSSPFFFFEYNGRTNDKNKWENNEKNLFS